MNLTVIVATLEGCPFDVIDNPETIEWLLREAVSAGGFTLLHSHVERFVPQGVTGAVVLSESHVNLHSWPEEGVLFVDLATCSSAQATRAAFERICDLIPHQSVRQQEIRYDGQQGGRPSSLSAGRLAVLPRENPSARKAG
jgi:S-adenosylmethionine decarboxylase